MSPTITRTAPPGCDPGGVQGGQLGRWPARRPHRWSGVCTAYGWVPYIRSQQGDPGQVRRLAAGHLDPVDQPVPLGGDLLLRVGRAGRARRPGCSSIRARPPASALPVTSSRSASTPARQRAADTSAARRRCPLWTCWPYRRTGSGSAGRRWPRRSGRAGPSNGIRSRSSTSGTERRSIAITVSPLASVRSCVVGRTSCRLGSSPGTDAGRPGPARSESGSLRHLPGMTSTRRPVRRRQRGRGRPDLLRRDLGRAARAICTGERGVAALLLEHREVQRPVRAPCRRRAADGSRIRATSAPARRRPARPRRPGRSPRAITREHRRSTSPPGGRWACSSSAVGSRTSNGSPMKPT